MKSKKIILLSITIIFAVGTACFCLGYHFRIGEETSMKEEQMKDSEKTFHAFIDAINRNDFNSALNYIEPTEAQLIRLALEKFDKITGSNSINILSKWFPFFSAISGVDVVAELSPTVLSVDEQSDTSVITIAIRTGDALSFYHVYLIRIEETWYIQYAKKISMSEDTSDI